MNSDPITILHVDDDPEFLDLTNAFLQQVDPDLSVRSATSVEAGLEALATTDVDCIVSDFDMPGRDGIDFLTAVRKRGCSIPFILFTGKGSEEVASDAISAGVTDYIRKATNTEQYELLANRIRNATTQHLAEQHVQEVYEAIDHVSEGVSLVDAEGTFIYVNRAYGSIFGYAPEELVGTHWSALYRDDDDVRYMQEHVIGEITPDEAWRGTTLQMRNDGTQIRTEHQLAYTSGGMMVCIVSSPADASGVEADAPVLDAA